MRIAYVCADAGVPVFGTKGCSVHVQEVVRALRRQGATVDLFAAALGSSPLPGFEDVRVHRLAAPEGDLVARERAALAANDALRALIERHGPYDLVYERYSLWSFAAVDYARARAIPALLEVNAPLVDEQAAYRGLRDREGAERVAGRVFQGASVVLAVSDEIAGYVHRCAGGGAAPVRVMPNGVDPRRFDVAARTQELRPFTLGFVGSLKPWHGLPVVVDAFASLRRTDAESECRLLIVGNGPERERVQQMIAAHGLDRAVELTGAVPPDRIPHLLASMDVGLAPYPHMLHFYFSPLKILEYMAAGLPVVASRIGQIPDLVKDWVTGFLVPPGDAAALARAVEHLRSSPGLRRRMGCSARAAVLRAHTWEHIARQILQIASSAVPAAAARS